MEADLNRIRETIANKPFYIRKTNKDRKQYSFSFVRKLKDKISRKKETCSQVKKATNNCIYGWRKPNNKKIMKTPYEDYLNLLIMLYKAKENGRNSGNVPSRNKIGFLLTQPTVIFVSLSSDFSGI